MQVGRKCANIFDDAIDASGRVMQVSELLRDAMEMQVVQVTAIASRRQ